MIKKCYVIISKDETDRIENLKYHMVTNDWEEKDAKDYIVEMNAMCRTRQYFYVESAMEVETK
jgi:hypothetical protein